MPRRTKEDAQKTRTRILASALALFVKKGYDHTTFTDIAARLKMTKGAVYWHFETKEALLVALVNEMLEKFRCQMDELKGKRGLSFPVVTETMIAIAERIVEDPKGAAFFLLLQTQIRWGADSMSKTREQLMSRDTNGPYHILIRALENDIATGLVSKEVNPVSIASVCVSIWTGLVRSKIEKFLECDLATTLRNSYAAIWGNIESRK